MYNGAMITNNAATYQDPYFWLPLAKQRLLLNIERSWINQICKHHTPDTVAIVGYCNQVQLLSECSANTKIMFCDVKPVYHHQSVSICLSGQEQLPLPEESVDLLVLPHCYEQCHYKHWLNDISKIVKPEGNILFFQFNPISISSFLKNKCTQKWFSTLQLRNKLRQKHFQIICTEKYGSYLSKEWRELEPAKNYTSSIPFANLGYFILAKRKKFSVADSAMKFKVKKIIKEPNQIASTREMQ